MSSLFITHDLTLASVMCDRLAVMYCGKIVEYGDAKEIISKPKHPYTQLLLQSVLPAKIDKKFDIADYESLREPHTGGCHFMNIVPRLVNNVNVRCLN